MKIKSENKYLLVVFIVAIRVTYANMKQLQSVGNLLTKPTELSFLIVNMSVVIT